MRCSNCGSENPAGKRFCADCGARLDGGAPLPAREPRTSLSGERRHLTVLFCDLVNSTGIATQLDPEEWREVVANYHRTAAAAIERFGGYIAQYLGDGVMAYFGWPQAHENDAERAARAGLAILESISRLNENPVHVQLSARVGIHSGTVVVGAGAGKEADVFGDVPSIAARIQSIAEPETVLITGDTHRLVSGLFEVEERGRQPLKGIKQPVEVCQVIQPSETGRQLSGRPHLTPFAGRGDELCLLLSRWQRVRHGEGQVVIVVGEPGIGKSRLIRQFHEQIGGDQYVWIESAGDRFAQSTPFHAVTEMLRQQISSSGRGNADESIERLASLLEVAGLKAQQALPLIAPLLNLPVPKNYPPVPAAPEEQRRQLLASLSRWVIGTAKAQPAVIVLEDLQWVDASTVEFVKLLVEQGASAALMQIYMMRSGFDSPWPPLPHHTQLTLDRLSDCEAREIVESLASDQGLSPEMVMTVVQRATGVPLFVEELARDSMERGKHSTPRDIPATLRDSLTARLDRLGPARELAQIGAVIGREFSYELLRLVAEVGKPELQLGLDNLVDAGLLHLGPSEPGKSYSFKHALVQDAAYNTLLKSRRREVHQRIAQLLEERFPETAASTPELLAHHYTEADLITQAVRYLRKAGQKAVERSANAEAIVHLAKGLELLGTLTPTPDIKREEIRLQSSLINPLIATKGYTAPEVERACTRAKALCHELGDPPRLFTVFGGLFAIYHNSGKFRAAAEIAEQMLSWAETMRDTRLLMWSYYSLGVNSEAQGKLPSARTYLEQSLALYDAEQRGSYGFVQDPNVTGSGLLAHVLHALGYPDQAVEKSQKALSDARELKEPYTLAWAIGATAALYVRRGEYLRGRELANELLAICTEHGFLPFSAEGHVWCGLALVHEGRGDEGIARILQGLTIGETAIQHRLFELYLAIAYWQMGRAKEGLSTVENSLAQMSDESEAYNTMPDLYRLKGELLLLQDAVEVEVEQFLQRAIRIARKNDDKTAELQATTSLARLLRNTSRRDEARAMLAEIYNWFTEGFDTADLKEAKALLGKLSR